MGYGIWDIGRKIKMKIKIKAGYGIWGDREED